LRQAYEAFITALIVLACVVGALQLLTADAKTRGFDVAWPGAGTVLLIIPWLGLALFALGAVRGPVVGAPFETYVAAQTGSPWPAFRFKRFWVAAGRAVAVVLLTWALVALGAVEVFTGQDAPAISRWVWAATAALGAGLFGSVCWLAGQAAPKAGQLLTPLLLVGLAVWSALGWPSAALNPSVDPLAGAVALLAGLVAALATPRLLRGIGLNQRLGQAIRWEAAGTALLGGTASEAAAAFQVRPRGRHLGAGRAKTWRRALIALDGWGLIRTAGASFGGLAALVTAGALVAAALPGGPPLLLSPGVIGLVAGLVGFGALGPFCHGLRNWSSDFRGQRQYGTRPLAMVAVRSVYPVVAGAVAVGIGLVLRAPAADAALAFSVWPLWLAVLLVLRMADTLRGALPDYLQISVSTPGGDFMPVARWIWQMDGYVLAGLFGWWAAATAHGGRVPWVAGAVVLAFACFSLHGRWSEAKQ
jgi:hypothetical protein